MKFRRKAERDAEAILEWLLSQHIGQTGIDWFLALDDAFGSLAEFPDRCLYMFCISATVDENVSHQTNDMKGAEFGVRFKRRYAGVLC